LSHKEQIREALKERRAERRIPMEVKLELSRPHEPLLYEKRPHTKSMRAQAVLLMQRDEICVCGHPQSLHRTYGCIGMLASPDAKRTERLFCQCKEFKARKAAHA